MRKLFDPDTLENVILSDANPADDFADVFVEMADHANGQSLTDSELDWLNEEMFDWVFEYAFENWC